MYVTPDLIKVFPFLPQSIILVLMLGLRGTDTVSGEATIAKLFLPLSEQGFYSKTTLKGNSLLWSVFIPFRLNPF